MKSKASRITFWVVVIAAILLTAALLLAGFLLLYPEEVFQVPSPNGDYVLHFYQIGSPGFPLGPVTVLAAVTDSRGYVSDATVFRLQTDGASLSIHNFSDAQWSKDSVTFLLLEEGPLTERTLQLPRPRLYYKIF